MDPRQFRDTLGRMPTGVTVITTRDPEGGLHGVTIGSFTSLSLDPPLVMWALDKKAICHPAFMVSSHFAVNVLAEDQSELSRIFASQDPRPWHALQFRRGAATGAPLMDGAIAWLECERTSVHPGGDHTIVIGRVLDLGQSIDGRPLLFFGGGYRRLEMARV